jgi:hypothetical protein
MQMNVLHYLGHKLEIFLIYGKINELSFYLFLSVKHSIIIDFCLVAPFSLLFVRVNTCPYQGSRTIRTEEAVLISLASFQPFIEMNTVPADKKIPVLQATDVHFSDDASEESDDE